MASLKLLFYGLVLGLLSSFYPRVSLYLPSSVVPFLPFLSHSHDPTSSWTTSFRRHQDLTPAAEGYKPGRRAEWEAEVEQRLRFGDKNGGREIEKEFKRQLREVESRAEKAGSENAVNEVLPFYFVEQDADLAALALELDALEPRTVVLLAPHQTTSSHLLVSASSSISSHSEDTSFPSSPRLAQALLTAFAHHAPSGVPATSSALVSLTPTASRVLSALSLDGETEVVQVLLPVLPRENGGGWEAEKWWDVGRAVGELLNEKVSGKEASGTRKGELKWRNTIVIALGNAVPKKASPVFPSLLLSALSAHTSHPRDQSLSSLYSSSASGSGKPQKAIKEDIVALLALVAAAGEGEGEEIAGGSGWRFGGLPVR